jgi:hypothetical protein
MKASRGLLKLPLDGTCLIQPNNPKADLSYDGHMIDMNCYVKYKIRRKTGPMEHMRKRATPL